MDVTSIALGGLEAAQGLLEKSAKRLAGVGAAASDGARDGVDLSAEIVELLAAREQFQANARVVRTADEMQKSVLDVLL